jgi:hypothetical protein
MELIIIHFRNKDVRIMNTATAIITDLRDLSHVFLQPVFL